MFNKFWVGIGHAMIVLTRLVWCTCQVCKPLTRMLGVTHSLDTAIVIVGIRHVALRSRFVIIITLFKPMTLVY